VRGWRRLSQGSLAGLAVAAAALFGPTAATAGIEEYGLESSSALISNTQAGGHPEFETRFKINHRPSSTALWASSRDIVTELPPGLLGNPAAFPTCETQVFFDEGTSAATGKPVCPTDTQIGYINPGVEEFTKVGGPYRTPLFNLEAPGGNSGIVARFGFTALFSPIFIDVRIDPKRGYTVTAAVTNLNQLATLEGSYNHFWGVPTDHSHDKERYSWFEALLCSHLCGGKPPVPSGLSHPTPFMDNPTSCRPAQITTTAISYQALGFGDSDLAALPEFSGCEAVPFEPALALAPTSASPGTSSGLEVGLHVPQQGLTDPEAHASADIEKAVTRLPQGLSLNASAADGLGSCTMQQIGLDRKERQIVEIGPSGPETGAHGAAISLSLGGQSTSTLPQLASAAEVQAALEALPNVGAGNVSVSGRDGGPWTVDFGGALAGIDLPTVGGTRSELQRLTVDSSGPTYTLGFEGEETVPLPSQASADEIRGALEGLAGIGAGGVQVTSGSTFFTGFFRIAFTGPLVGEDVAAITTTGAAEVATLADGGAPVFTETVQEGGTIRFDGVKPSCPESSKVATGEISTPVLRDPLHADFYIAKQSDNPYNSLFAGYLVAKGDGALVKVPAKIDVDPGTGQVTTTFTDNPQQPFEDLELHFKGGNRGLFTTPSACGTYKSTYEFFPWSGNPPAKGTSEFTLDQNCGEKAFAPGFEAGSSNALAGSFTSLATRVTNGAGAPPLTGISVQMPEGVAAKLAGVSVCPDSALSALPTTAGTGGAELARPSCPASSLIGSVVAGGGSGSPFYVEGGRVYLAGPYKGAPLSLAVITPAVAGPFDLGNVLTRVAVNLDPATARVSASSDTLPTMLEGVPLDLRDVRVLLDRQGFATNPTNCEPEAATGVITGQGGRSANVSDRFQVGECAALGFKPKLALRLSGGARRLHPALTAVLRPREGDANISRISVTLPSSEFIDQSHFNSVCTRVQFAANACPAGSIYGKVTATTPLLEEPLSGNVYLRSNPAHELPDLVTDLHGPASRPIHLEAAGKNDSVHGALRNTFEFVPDAPISRVVLKMKGGKKGLFQNSEDICAQPPKAAFSFTAHNGRTYSTNQSLQVGHCGHRHKGKARHPHRRG
jgi:hypothetical protein